MARRPSGSLGCTGPSPYGEVYGGNGYIIAITPFLPETALKSISYAVEACRRTSVCRSARNSQALAH